MSAEGQVKPDPTKPATSMTEKNGVEGLLELRRKLGMGAPLKPGEPHRPNCPCPTCRGA